MEHLRIFGTVAYAHIPKIKRKKMDDKADKVYFVGYEADSRNYRVYYPETREIYTATDLVFDEECTECLNTEKTDLVEFVLYGRRSGDDNRRDEPDSDDDFSDAVTDISCSDDDEEGDCSEAEKGDEEVNLVDNNQFVNQRRSSRQKKFKKATQIQTRSKSISIK